MLPPPPPAPVRSFVCAKWGTKYPAAEVNRLYRALARVTQGPFQLICVTDDASGLSSDIEAVPIPDLPVLGNAVMNHGWRKLTLFSPALRQALAGPQLFLDLDVVLLGRLERFFTYDSAFAVIKDYRPVRYRNRWAGNTSVFFFDGGRDYGVYNRLQVLGHEVTERYRNEQEFLCDVMRQQRLLRYWPQGWCASWKHDCVPLFPRSLYQSPEAPPEARVLVFHGRPKPEEAVEGVGAKWYRPMRPAPWLLRYLDT